MDGRGVRLLGRELELPETAVTVRVRDGETAVSDGPFAETKEFTAGLDLLECADLDEVIEVAAKHPSSWFHTIEIRPFMDGLGLGEEASAFAREDAAFREEWGRVVATLIRRISDWDLAEECAQEAFTEALRRWPVDGVPQRPGAWLTTVAGNRALDRLRRRRRGAALIEQVGGDPTGAPHATMDSHKIDTDEDGGIEDDRLRLIFTCCHPALPLEGRVALTLRSLAGARRCAWRQSGWRA